MKKLLFFSLLISLNTWGQTKIEAYIDSSETGTKSVIIGYNRKTSDNGDALRGITLTKYGSGVVGVGYGFFGKGVYGIADSGTGADNGIGVYGFSQVFEGVHGLSNGPFGIGVSGECYSYYGVLGTTAYGNGVRGIATHAGIGGYFSSTSGHALITNSGNVGIGISAPINILEVNGRARLRHTGNTAGIWMNNSANSASVADGAFYGMKNDTEAGIWIGNNWRFWVNSAGNGYLNGNLIQTSDKRLKKDFSPLHNSLQTIAQLNGYHYKWLEESRSKDLQTGLIAQEVQKIFPELVQTDEKGFLSVNYIGLVPHLIEAVKELRNENNALKGKNQSLESRLDKIEALLTAQLQQLVDGAKSK
ncbi:tail fiber domain-containing protein [Emticicia agri]|uniref:Peptidase S74 domain-containing protein n=1 Tax=Emticicia agri TaxID=2492393 RepID=A0A4Q5LVA3_9BACT|nr:tail fiber domain-containing protein [Emticicia agri]RYU93592.1 hypothetical protein EWM59_21330 [Emticicia agri]